MYYDVGYFDELEAINAVLDSIFEEGIPPESKSSEKDISIQEVDSTNSSTIMRSSHNAMPK